MMKRINCQSTNKEQQIVKTFFKEKKDYEAHLLEAQTKFLSLQQSIFRKKRKLIIVLEGSDTAGKGGIVRRMAQHLDPRMFHVYGIGKPTSSELGQHYMQRFFSRLPNPGEMTVFDRSWYGRILVEKVEGLVNKTQYLRAFDEINNVEKLWHDDGMIILKYLLDISYLEQGIRFKEREQDPLKSWKMTDEDYRNRRQWNAYQLAFKEMIKKTSTKICPWNLVPADSKWFARVHILNDIVKKANQAL